MLSQGRNRPRRRVAAALFACGAMYAMASCGESPTGDGGDPPSLALSADSAGLSATQGGPSPTTTLDVSNGGGGTLAGLGATITYGSGQPTGWLSAGLSATTAPASLDLEADPGSLVPGTYGATVQVSAGGGVSPLDVQVTLTLDLSTPPVIDITSPTRGAMLQQGTAMASDVQITGTVCHDSVPITVLDVNGVSLPVSGTNLCEPFDVVQSSAWGLSIVEVHAENEYGRSADAVRSYLRSPDYYPPAFASDAAAQVATGVLARLNQAVIDDGNRADLDDFASVLQLGLNALNIDGYVPTTLYRDPSNAGQSHTHDCVVYTATANRTGIRATKASAVSVGARTLNALSATTDALYVSAGVGAVSVPLDIDAWLDLHCLSSSSYQVSGTIGVASASGSGNVDVTTDVLGVHASASGVSTTVTTPSVNVNFAVLDALGDAVIDVAVATLESGIESVVGDFIADFIQEESAPTLESLVESLVLEDTTTVRGAALAYEAEPDFVDFDGPQGSGNGEIGLVVQVIPTGTPVAPGAPHGSIRVASTPLVFSSFQYEMAVAIKDDMVNQALWAAWQGGVFEVADLATFTGQSYDGFSAAVSALLPPILNEGTALGPVIGGQNHVVVVQWGDVVLDGLADPADYGLPGFQTGSAVPFQGFVSGSAEVDVTYDSSAERLEAAVTATDLHVEIASDPAAALDHEALGAAVAAALADFVETVVPDALGSVPVPVLDIGTLFGVPAGSVIRLESATVEYVGRQLRIQGNVGS